MDTCAYNLHLQKVVQDSVKKVFLRHETCSGRRQLD